jgi:glyoxylase-like metal-dependent hydrolase (beta-lactamase superfamily II)
MIHGVLSVGMLAYSCSVLGDESTGEAVVIGPGDEAERIQEILAKHRLPAKYTVATRAHIDHVGGTEKRKRATRAAVLMHEADLPLCQNLASQAEWMGVLPPGVVDVEQFLKEGDTLRCGGLSLEVLRTPGLPPGSVSLHLPGENAKILCGNTLPQGSIGRTDLWGGSFDELLRSIRSRRSFSSIRRRSLPDTVRRPPSVGSVNRIPSSRPRS